MATMTRQHFQAIANAFWEARQAIDADPSLDAFTVVEEQILRVLRASNPQFDERRFHAATWGK